MGRRLTALLGPRCFGKTSLLRQVTANLAAVGPETVWVDLYECSSMADVAVALDVGLATSPVKVRRVMESIASSLSVQLGFFRLELTKPKRERPDARAVVQLLLEMLVKSAQRQPLILVLDEFSGLAEVKGAAGVLRTGLQHHYRDLGIVFASSQPSTMATLFADQAQPFFAQADLIEIGPLPGEAVDRIVHEGFERTGRNAGVATPAIVAMSDGHPQRAMQLADAAWRRTEPGDRVDDPLWEEALAAVRQAENGSSERLYELVPPGQQKVLRVVASGGSVYGTAADAHGLSPGTATAGVRALTGNGYLADRAGRLRLVDPLFADWLRRRFPM